MAKNELSDRKYIVGAIIFAIAFIYIIRLYQLQVIDEELKLSADNNVLRKETLYPSRGLIYDRNDKLIVYNKAAYDLMIVPKKVKDIDVKDFCNTLNITEEQYQELYKKARKYSSYRPSIFITQLSPEDYAVLQEKMYKYPGYYVVKRTLRDYIHNNGAHVLGYTSEVSPRLIKKNDYYSPGDYIGSSGIESTYEKNLRGEKGLRISLVDVHGRVKGKFSDGAYDKTPISGSDINISLDIELQAYGEKLLQNKIGSVVAIEPSTGEVLALISSPTFDPALMVGRSRSKHYGHLQKDSLKPLNNRAIQGNYPPGSTFKIVNAAIALQEQVVNESTLFTCAGEQTKPIKCTHFHGSLVNISQAIETSCNPFFWQAYRNIIEQTRFKNIQEAYTNWYDYLIRFGFNSSLGIDLPYAMKGDIKKSKFYDNLYGSNGWRALTIRSLAIGQGEISVTPLQMANEVAIIANRGYYYRPHLIKNIKQDSTAIDSIYKEKIDTRIEKRHFDLIINAMRHVYDGDIGTARYYKNDSLSMCGKTGTVQNPHGADHSMFIAFAPTDTPKIAIAVIVENGGYGSRIAAPVATLMMEKYLLGSIPPRHKIYEDRMYEIDLIHDVQTK